jgi:UDP-2,3-diacylglucosamine pyrophosphatase LpxH
VGHYSTVVISDLHLGAGNSCGETLLRFLDWVRADHIVIGGDLFDRPGLGRLRDTDLRVLEALRQFGMDRRLEWLVGNHDPSPRFFRAVLGIEPQDETLIDADNGRRYLVYHGHAWDEALNWPNWLIAGADGFYRFSQWLDPTHSLAKFLKHRCKTFVKAVENLRDRAVEEARRRGLDGVILGHSHMACDRMIDGIHYLNSGCWTEKPAGFVGFIDGVARQERWDPSRRVTVAVGASVRRARVCEAVTASAAATTAALVAATMGTGETA